MFKKLFCNHNWVLAEKIVVPSRAEILENLGMTVKEGNVNGRHFDQKIVVILKCTECGKLDKTEVQRIY